MEVFIFSAIFPSQIVCTAAQEEAEEAACSPGFQLKKYHVENDGGFLKDQPVLQSRKCIRIMEFDTIRIKKKQTISTATNSSLWLFTCK